MGPECVGLLLRSNPRGGHGCEQRRETRILTYNAVNKERDSLLWSAGCLILDRMTDTEWRAG